MAARLLKQLDDAWTRWLAVLDRVQTAQRDEKVLDDNWSVKDLVDHTRFWDAEVLTDIQRWQLGLPPVSNDWQAMNDQNRAAHHEQPYDLVRVEMHLVHQTVRDAIERLPDDLPDTFVEQIAVDTWDHYDDHAKQIEAWLEK